MSTPISFQAVTSRERLPLLDILRGFASLGILLVNIHSFADTGWYSPEQKAAMPTHTVDAIVGTVLDVLIDTKFITLFSILFGVGFAIQLERAKAAGIAFRSYFVKRMLLLLVIGCVHAYLLWFGDIIRYYAAAGLFLLLFINWKPKAILRMAIFLAAFVTASVFIVNAVVGVQYTDYPSLEQIKNAFAYGNYHDTFSLNWRIDPVRNFLQDSLLTTAAVFGRVLLGYWLGRLYFFTKPSAFAMVRRKWFWWGLCYGIPCSVAFWAIKAGVISLDSYWLLWLPYAIVCGLLLQSFFYLEVILRWHENPTWRKRLQLFAPVGRMPLTNYILQTIFCIVLFYGWFPGLHLRGVGNAGLLFIGLAVFGLQILVSRWWLRSRTMGPIEWVWKKLSYPTQQPKEKPAPSSRTAPV